MIRARGFERAWCKNLQGATYEADPWGRDIDSLRRRRGLLDDADEREAGAPVDVVLLVRQDEGLRRHHLQVRAPRLDPRRRVHLQWKEGKFVLSGLRSWLSDPILAFVE